MKKYIIGFFLGGMLATACFVPLLIQQRNAQFISGSQHGQTTELFEVVSTLDKEFGRYDGNGKYTRLFGVKTTGSFRIVVGD
jgi:hypothetical protein